MSEWEELPPPAGNADSQSVALRKSYSVVTATGDAFNIELDGNANARDAKAAISNVTGQDPVCQLLFAIPVKSNDKYEQEDRGDGEIDRKQENRPLCNEDIITEALGELYLIFRIPPLTWAQWGEGLDLAGEDQLTVINRRGGSRRLATGSVVACENDCEYYWEVQLTAGSLGGLFVGAVGMDLDHNTNHIGSNDALLLSISTGGLYGAGKNNDDMHGGRRKIGDRAGVHVTQVGNRRGSVHFFVNEKRFGPGFNDVFTGPLVLGVQMPFEGQSVTILPTGQLPRSLTQK
jgi:hypothetical protein